MAGSYLLNSPLFTPRFVTHRQIWRHEADVCFECIDRTDYTSVVVRIAKFETGDMEAYKAKIEQARKDAVAHPNIARLVDILIDENIKCTLTVSENPRGLSFSKIVETYSNQKCFNGMVQEVLLSVLDLFKTLNESQKDLIGLPLRHLVIGVDLEQKIESIKVRRPYLNARTRRDLLAPYNRYPIANPSLVDLVAVAYYAFTQVDLFQYETAEAALELLNGEQRTFVSKLFAANVNYEDIKSAINEFFAPESVEVINGSDCDASETSETSSFGLCTEDEIKEAQNHGIYPNLDESEAEGDFDVFNESVATAIENEDDSEVETVSDVEEIIASIEEDDDTQTAIAVEDEEVHTANDNSEETETAIEDVDDETKTAIEDEDEVRTAVGDDEDEEVRTAIDDSEETETAIEDDDDETKTAIDGDDDDDTKTAIEADDGEEVCSAIDEDEIKDDFEICATNTECEFGLHIPNLANVFKYHPEFYLAGATLTVEDNNTLVYNRQFSSVTYRKLTVFCEGDEVVNVKYEHCYGSQIRGKCSNSVTYTHFAEMCPESKFCLMEVYIAVANSLAGQTLFTFKNYGHEGLTILFMADNSIHCEFEDQYCSYENGKEFATSDAQDKMPADIPKIIEDLSKMAQSIRATTPNKKFTINFTEE